MSDSNTEVMVFEHLGGLRYLVVGDGEPPSSHCLVDDRDMVFGLDVLDARRESEVGGNFGERWFAEMDLLFAVPSVEYGGEFG